MQSRDKNSNSEPCWFQDTYRRTLFDMHVDDWHKQFLSEFDPKKFVDTLVLAKGCTATVPANNHAGLSFWPTRAGKMHAGLKGRDVLGEMIHLCHNQGLNVVVYYCTIYVDWYWENYPSARVVDAQGKSSKLLMNSAGHPRRLSPVCMNNPAYRNFVVAELEDVCQRYDFEGVWPDMTFWPTVCYCDSCRERYAAEVGREIPTVINWEDPTWVKFQRKREEWVADFAHLVTSTIKQNKPTATVAHQSHTFSGDWLFGASIELSREMDWLSADLYRDRYEQAFYAKLFYDLSENKPFEHLNTWCYPNIHEHVVTRTKDHLRVTAFSTLMNHGAIVFIDAVDPLGTVNRDNYIKAGEIFEEVARYEPYLGGDFCQDIGIYFGLDALIDLAENGQPVIRAGYNFEPGRSAPGPAAHRNAAIILAKTLLNNHLPFGVITRKNLAALSNYQIVILPNLVMLGEEEAEAFKDYVSSGGGLYASKNTSLITKEGQRQDNFLLHDLFGVTYLGETQEVVTYVTPRTEWQGLFPSFSAQYPVTLYDSQAIVKVDGNAEILATLTLPYTDPRGTRYASILSDPPGVATEYPSIVLNRYAKGKVLYAAGVLEAWQHDSQRSILINLLRLLATQPFHFEAVAPKAVEITCFNQAHDKRYVLHLLNAQEELPNIPVEGIKLRVWLEKRVPENLIILPQREELSYSIQNGWVEFTVPRLETYMMLALSYQ